MMVSGMQGMGGFQIWKDVLFIHWEVDAQSLQRRIPPPLQVDTFEGRAWISLVPFEVAELRMHGLPRRFRLSFLETNLRTYVTLRGADPGVYFFSLDAASLTAVLGARAGFGLPYFYSSMLMIQRMSEVSYRMRRRSRRGPVLEVSYRWQGELPEAGPGTLDHFLVERRTLHTRRGRDIWSVDVEHPPYPLREVALLSLHTTLPEAAGLAPAPPLPLLAHFSPGTEVTVRAPRRQSIMDAVSSSGSG